MVPGRVSVLIPSRNERFLCATVRDVLAHAQGDIEVWALLDGVWADPVLPDDPRLHVLYMGTSQGMRAMINAGARLASGQFLMKLDAHCSLTEGFDLVLSSSCDDDCVMTLRRDRLDAEAWGLQDTGKPPIDYHYLDNPFREIRDPTRVVGELGGVVWPEKSSARLDMPIDDEMSSQGSMYFMSRRCWDERIGPLNETLFTSFWNEFQEIGMKCWLSGGSVRINKKATVLHLHKGKRYGRGYPLSKPETDRGLRASTRFWMLDGWLPEWPVKKHNLAWLVERFMPVPNWDDPDKVCAEARRYFESAS
ncbi:MAG TPA: glycosyltransferase [Anaerolineae bacterium]